VEKGDIPKERYFSYIKLKRESEHAEMTQLDRRKKDRAIGRFYKSAKKQMKNRRRIE
jgi:ribosome biogenesis GTPase